ncbi:MAG TPA: glycosyltransferase [Acidimicrobiales bacterium]
MAVDQDVTVVIATRNRRERLAATLAHLRAADAPTPPRVVVVDNGSHDGTPATARAAGADVIELGRNLGAPARTIGVAAATTPHVAFCDDDSWYAPGALATAAAHLHVHPHLALVAARILVGPEERLDPLSAEMAASPLRVPRPLPGPPVLGFAACGAVVRREAYLQVGGFSPLLFFLGEERLLAYDLAAAGWDLAYAPDVVAHHHPAFAADGDDRARRARRAQVYRNDLLSDWLRRPVRRASRATLRLARQARHDPAARTALADAARCAPAVLRRRRRLPPGVERAARLLDARPGPG